MVKYIRMILIVLLLMIPSVALGDDIYQLVINQVHVELPELEIYIDVEDSIGDQISDMSVFNDKVSVVVDGVEADILEVQSTENDPTAYILGIDISKSLSTREFREAKSMIITWVNMLLAEDQVAIITFGEEVNLLSDYTNSKETLIDTINRLELTDQSTKLFEGISLAHKFANTTNLSLPNKKAILFISDGVDDYPGAITEEEVLENISTDAIPMYMIGLYNGYITNTKQSYLDILGRFARATNGRYYQEGIWDLDDIPLEIEEHGNRLYKVNVSLDNQKADGTQKLVYVELKKDNLLLDQSKSVTFDTNMIDVLPPEVLRCTQIESNQVELVFNEKIIGYDNPGNYKIEGLDLTVDEVKYDNSNEVKVIVTFDRDIPLGEYDFLLNNISDISENYNTITSMTLKLKCILEPEVIAIEEVVVEETNQETDDTDSEENDWDVPKEPVEKKTNPFLYIIGLVVLVIIIVVVIIFVIKKKKNKVIITKDVNPIVSRRMTGEYNQRNVSKQVVKETPPLPNRHNDTELIDNETVLADDSTVLADDSTVLADDSTVLADDSVYQSTMLLIPRTQVKVTLNNRIIYDDYLEEPCIFGRSDQSSVTINDSELSRKHMKFFIEDDEVFVEDLNSTNGTSVNDVKISSAQLLHSGDRIRIGQSDLIVEISEE